MTYRITIPGEPVPQGRPRFSRRGGFVQTYDPPKSKAYKTLVSGYAARRAEKVLTGPLHIEVAFYMPIRKSWTKKRKQACLEGLERPTTKIDIDNLLKGLLDGCNGILYEDDGQIVSVAATKHYSDEPRVEMEIRQIDVS